VDRILVKHAVYEQVLQSPAVHDAAGVEVRPAVYGDGDLLEPEEYEEIRTVTPGVPAGNCYGIRYEEALRLDAAYQRPRANRLAPCRATRTPSATKAASSSFRPVRSNPLNDLSYGRPGQFPGGQAWQRSGTHRRGGEDLLRRTNGCGGTGRTSP